MNSGSLVWGEPQWAIPAVVLFILAVAAACWSYARQQGPPWVRGLAAVLRLTAASALALCLMEPLFSNVRPRPQANRFVILADNSRSMTLRGTGTRTRGEEVRTQLQHDAPWQARLARDFELRRYVFDASLRPVRDFDVLDFGGTDSALSSALRSIAQRAHSHPTAGVLLLSDGNATDSELNERELKTLPPIYPVVTGEEARPRDLRIQRVVVSESNFEAAPVNAAVEIACQGIAGEPVLLQLFDKNGDELQRQVLRGAEDGQLLSRRLQLQPKQPGVSFYEVRVIAAAEEDAWLPPHRTREATLANNRRWIVVDRGQGPYRILYVAGRPNWEFKFLRRAAAEDEEIQLVGLVRIAKREPKFTFRGRQGETTNPLYRGFSDATGEQAEQYDEPVLKRLGTEDDQELRDGFPKDAAGLFRYHAVILDDVEAGFFTRDQMSLIQQFVSQRGGGFLMLGGQESFAEGAYEHTPIAELLPVYLDGGESQPRGDAWRWGLTREGWLEPWIRLRTTEAEERQRLGKLSPLRVVNSIPRIKPGASVLADVRLADGKNVPALTVQRFGRGQSGALLAGDLWRWQISREEGAASNDLDTTWRQMVRWLVADVPDRVEVEIRPAAANSTPAVDLVVSVRDALYQPLDNASVEVALDAPDDQRLTLRAESDENQPGVYQVQFAPRVPGPYRVQVTATADDGIPVGTATAGWPAESATKEFAALTTNKALLQNLAERTGGEVISRAALDAFVRSLPQRKVPVVESWTYPLWQQWPIFLGAVVCLMGEWGLRRWQGLP
jgi:hypothetical protein